MNQIQQKVAYSTVIPDDRSAQSLKEYYEDAHVTDKFIDSESSVLKFQIKQAWDKLGKPTDKNEWSMPPSEVNAYYALLYNQVCISFYHLIHIIHHLNLDLDCCSSRHIELNCLWQ